MEDHIIADIQNVARGDLTQGQALGKELQTMRTLLSYAGIGFLAGIVAVGDPHWSRLFLKNSTLWKGTILAQFLKNCCPWEGPILEWFMKDRIL